LNNSNLSLSGIPPERYEEFAKICYANALNILEDAKILYDAGKYPRSYALSVIAAEELNKALFFKLVSAGIMGIENGLDDESRFALIENRNDSFRKFAGEILVFHENAKIILDAKFWNREVKPGDLKRNDSRVELSNIFEKVEEEKHNALYTGFDSKKILEPSAAISQEKCYAMLGHVRFSAISSFKQLLDADNTSLRSISEIINKTE